MQLNRKDRNNIEDRAQKRKGAVCFKERETGAVPLCVVRNVLYAESPTNVDQIAAQHNDLIGSWFSWGSGSRRSAHFAAHGL